MKRSDHRGKESPKIKLRPEPVIRPNERDRSEQAEKKRSSFRIMNFLGLSGLLQFITRPNSDESPRGVRSETLRSRGVFRHFYHDDPDKMRAAFVRHIHPRRKRNDKAYCNAKYEAYLATLPR